MKEEDLRDLTLCAYRAGMDGGSWQDFVNMLDERIDGVYVSLYGHDLRGKVPPYVVGTRYGEDGYPDYCANFAHINPFIPVLMRQPLLRVERSEVWVPEGELKSGQFYNDFLRPREDIGTGGGGVLFNDKQRVLILSGQVRSHEQDKADRLVEMIRHLAPHVRQAFEMRHLLQGKSLSADGYRGAFEAVSNALIILDSHGKVCDCNIQAEALFDRRELIGLDQFGVLRFLDPWGHGQFLQLLGEICSKGYSSSGSSLFSKDIHGDTHVARLTPMTSQKDSDAPLLHFVGTRIPAALLTIRCAEEADMSQSLQLAYKLTPAEAGLAQALYEGFSLQDYAETRNISPHTARTQLKAIFAKMDVRRQSDLIALLGKLEV